MCCDELFPHYFFLTGEGYDNEVSFFWHFLYSILSHYYNTKQPVGGHNVMAGWCIFFSNNLCVGYK